MIALFVAGALAMVGYFTLLSKSGPFAEKGRYLVVFFDDILGVSEGTVVTLLGVPIGRVHEIGYYYPDRRGEPVEPNSPERIGQKVVLTLDIREIPVFYENYSIAIRSPSILSDPAIVIDPGSMNARDGSGRIHKIVPVSIPDSNTLDEENTTAFEYLIMERRSRALPELNGESAKDPITAFSNLLAENRPGARRGFRNVENISQKINAERGTIGILLNDDELFRNGYTVVNRGEVLLKHMRKGSEDTRAERPVDSAIRVRLFYQGVAK
jgi:ABC-type transporter Mla subunit MlaD